MGDAYATRCVHKYRVHQCTWISGSDVKLFLLLWLSNVNVFSLGLSNATEEQQEYSAIWGMPMLQGVCTSTGCSSWHPRRQAMYVVPFGFLVVLEKPNRSSFTFTTASGTNVVERLGQVAHRTAHSLPARYSQATDAPESERRSGEEEGRRVGEALPVRLDSVPSRNAPCSMRVGDACGRPLRAVPAMKGRGRSCTPSNLACVCIVFVGAGACMMPGVSTLLVCACVWRGLLPTTGPYPPSSPAAAWLARTAAGTTKGLWCWWAAKWSRTAEADAGLAAGDADAPGIVQGEVNTTGSKKTSHTQTRRTREQAHR
jgi:hypothetical protein